MRIAACELYQETCVNSPETTTKADFNVAKHDGILDKFRNTGSEMGGVIDQAEEHDDVELVPTISARASPSGPVSDDTFETLADSITGQLRNVCVDGVILALHGAMLTAKRDDPEGEILSSIRDAVGDIPIVATLDPHAHLTPQMVDEATALVTYQTTPHVDIFETGQEGTELLIKTLRGDVTPQMSMVKVPTMISQNQQLLDHVKQLETEHSDVLRACYSPVQAFIDASDMGHVGLVITDDNQELADELSKRLAQKIWSGRKNGTPVRPTGRPSVSQVLGRIAQSDTAGLSVLMDDGDHMCAGAPGDSPVFLRELLREEHSNLSAALQLVDPDTTQELMDSNGEVQTISLGGKITPGFDPVTVEAEVTGVFDEPLTIGGELYPGTQDFFGTRVVLDITNRDVQVVVTENSGLANDPPFFKEHGITPADLDVLVIQCAHNVADYQNMAEEIVRVHSPGVTSQPYDFLRKARPIYPLDAPSPSFEVFDGYWKLRK